MGKFKVEGEITAKNLTDKGIGKATKNIQKFEKSVKKFNITGKKFARIGSSMARAGKSISIGFAAVVVPIALFTKKAADFEMGIARVSTLLDKDVSQTMAQFGDDIKRLAILSGKGTDDLTNGLFQTISAGVDATKSLKFMTLATKASVGGFTDVETVVNGLTNVINSYGLSIDKAGTISDQFFIANKLGKTTIGELSVSIGRIASVASDAGLSTADLLSSITAITKGGLDTNRTITGLAAALSNIEKPSTMALEAINDLNKGLPEDKQIQFGVEAIKTLGWERFILQLKELQQVDQSAFVAIFESREARASLQTLFKQMDTFRESTALMNRATDKASLTQTNFNKISRTNAFRLGQTRQALNNTAIAIGEVLLPEVAKLADKVKVLVDRFLAWKKANPGVLTAIAKTALKYGKFVGAIGISLVVFGKIAGAIGTIITVIGKLGIALKAIGAIAAANPLILGLIALVGIGAFAIKKIREIQGVAGASPEEIAAFNQQMAGIASKAEQDRLTRLGIMPEAKQVFTVSAPKEMGERKFATEALARVALEKQQGKPGANIINIENLNLETGDAQSFVAEMETMSTQSGTK